MNARKLTRRKFINRTAGVIGGALLFPGGPIATLAPQGAWALKLSKMDSHQGETLLQMTRLIFPHEKLEDAVYALVVKRLDSSNIQNLELLIEGIVELDTASGGRWLDLLPSERSKVLSSLEGTPFFEKLRSTAVVDLYNNDMAFAHFGYEGEAFSKGGYLTRGFNDLEWLPAPSANASPHP
ncbi:tat (twin-arginine translocation) pathway signal sequence [Myxococcota bacterium]|nr:tat (twin-arginine translocation) pathway signal sequence [Myxococcota bacterium]